MFDWKFCVTFDFVLKDFPMAIVGTANRQVIIYQLDNQPAEFKVSC